MSSAVDSRNSPRKLIWFQFRLRTLLLLAAGSAIACSWYVTSARVREAQQQYWRTYQWFEQGIARGPDVCEASLQWCRAEQSLWFAGGQKPWERHFARVKEIERAQHSLAVTSYGSLMWEDLERVRHYLREAALMCGHAAE